MLPVVCLDRRTRLDPVHRRLQIRDRHRELPHRLGEVVRRAAVLLALVLHHGDFFAEVAELAVGVGHERHAPADDRHPLREAEPGADTGARAEGERAALVLAVARGPPLRVGPWCLFDSGLGHRGGSCAVRTQPSQPAMHVCMSAMAAEDALNNAVASALVFPLAFQATHAASSWALQNATHWPGQSGESCWGFSG